MAHYSWAKMGLRMQLSNCLYCSIMLKENYKVLSLHGGLEKGPSRARIIIFPTLSLRKNTSSYGLI